MNAGMLHADPRGRVVEESDFVIVGSGAAGATAAATLAEAGYDVVILEEGSYVPPGSRSPLLPDAARDLFRDLGLSAAEGRAIIPLLQGRCVGGTTVINAGIIWRMPERVHRAWVEADPGIARALPWERLEAHYETVERALGVAPVTERIAGANNTLMARGARAAGVAGRYIDRNAPDCEGTGTCLQSCPRGNKLSMEVTFLPKAIAAGARLYARCRVERLTPTRAAAWRVEATLRHPVTGERRGTLTAGARRGVVLAASTLQTPALLRRNGIGHKRVVGEHLQAHPGCAVAGVFDEPVRMWEGVHQGYESTHLRDQGVKLEAIGLPPELAAFRLPGIGDEWSRRISRLDHVALWAVAVRCEAHGSVRPFGPGAVRVRYCPTRADVKKFQLGVKTLADMAFAAGARVVMPGMASLPTEMRDPRETRMILSRPADARDFQMVLTHLMGAARMGSDPERSAVGLDFQVHGAPGLYVADSSLFPTNLGVNPQHTIQAVAMEMARSAAARHADRAA
ncbi:MAG: GMC family oxidoreductase [Planctomycetes bacterium]|nr:GMC family oxidoreductase [Planctomycetota bacterium]